MSIYTHEIFLILRALATMLYFWVRDFNARSSDKAWLHSILSWGKKWSQETQERKSTTEFINRFFITFHHSIFWSVCGGIIAEDNKWVSSLMWSFDTTKSRSSLALFKHDCSFQLNYIISMNEKKTHQRINVCSSVPF